MGKIVAIHSFRGGTGKSNITANLGYCLLSQGNRVGIIDSDIMSPGIHAVFGLSPDDLGPALNAYLWGDMPIDQVAHDVTPDDVSNGGRLYLIPSSLKLSEISRVLREGYDVDTLSRGFTQIVDLLNLDVLLIDTHPGVNEETLLSIAVADAILIVLRLDRQDYQGTGLTLEIARRLGTRRYLVVNNIPPGYEFSEVEQNVEQAFGCDVAALLPHSPELLTLGSSECFYRKEPGHPFSQSISGLAGRIMEFAAGDEQS